MHQETGFSTSGEVVGRLGNVLSLFSPESNGIKKYGLDFSEKKHDLVPVRCGFLPFS